jgi:hypothetical protein
LSLIVNSPDVAINFQDLADGVGFEPTVGFHPRRFSRPLP